MIKRRGWSRFQRHETESSMTNQIFVNIIKERKGMSLERRYLQERIVAALCNKRRFVATE